MKPIFLLFLSACLAPGIASAQTPDLYSGSVPVEDRSQSTREEAFPRALEQVLGKLSGRRFLDDHPAVAPAIENARSLVVSFYYAQSPVGESGADDSLPQPEREVPKTLLVVRFAQPEVDELARRLGLPRWPPKREPLNVWLLVDDGLSRRVMPLEYQYLRAPIDRVAEVRGLPLAWPNAGEDGDYSADVQLLWGGYTETLAPDGGVANVLVIAARREGPEWNARLILDYEGEHRTWRNRDFDLEHALTEAIHQAIDEIAAAHSIALADQGNRVLEISVGGIRSGDDYARCLAYLDSLSVVEAVAIEGADPAGVRMSLTLNASPEYFEEAVAEGEVLEYDDASRQYVLQP